MSPCLWVSRPRDPQPWEVCWMLSADVCQITYEPWNFAPTQDGKSSEKLFMIVVGDFLPRLSELWPLNMSLLVSQTFFFPSLAGNFWLRSANSLWKLFILSLKVNGGLRDYKATQSQQSDSHGPTLAVVKLKSSCTTTRCTPSHKVQEERLSLNCQNEMAQLSLSPNLWTWIHLIVSWHRCVSGKTCISYGMHVMSEQWKYHDWVLSEQRQTGHRYCSTVMMPSWDDMKSCHVYGIWDVWFHASIGEWKHRWIHTWSLALRCSSPLLSAKCKNPSKFQKEDNSAQRTAGPKRNKMQSHRL